MTDLALVIRSREMRQYGIGLRQTIGAKMEGSLGRVNWGLSQWIEHEEIQNGKGVEGQMHL